MNKLISNILASSSPRRKEILEQIRFGFSVSPSKVNEDFNRTSKKFTGFAHAFKIVSELFANILVGASIGWTLDYFFNT